MKLTRRDRRALVLGTVALAMAAGYLGLVKPLRRARHDLEGRRDTAIEYLTRYRGIAAEGSVLVSAADTARARLVRIAPAAYAEEPGSAIALLLEHVQRLADASQVRLLRTNPAPAEPVAAGLQRIGVGLSCESDLAGLLELLRALETGEKLMHVSGLHVDAESGAGPGDVQVLRFELTLEAFILDQPTGSTIHDQTPAP